MSSNISTEQDKPSSSTTHLGTAWEVAIVVVFVVLVAALAAATIFQIRRKRREKRQREVESNVDLEKAERHRRRARRERRKHTESIFSESTITEERRGAADPQTEEKNGGKEMAKPSPTLQSKRLSKSSYHEYISKKPPKYYWDQR